MNKARSLRNGKFHRCIESKEFTLKNLEENVDAFNQALNKYLAEYEKY